MDVVLAVAGKDLVRAAVAIDGHAGGPPGVIRGEGVLSFDHHEVVLATGDDEVRATAGEDHVGAIPGA